VIILTGKKNCKEKFHDTTFEGIEILTNMIIEKIVEK